jgi:hypothetical protein
MPAVSLVVRDDKLSQPDSNNLNPTMLKLLIALLVLLVLSTILIATLVLLRSFQRKKRNSTSEKLDSSNYKRLTIDTQNTPAYAIQEKRNLIDNSSSPPASPVPEIRITFPDEVDKTGRPQSGRVVVVRMGENSAVGLEPLEDLPPYQKSEGGRFQSLDLERMGGLKEKELEKRYS